MKSAFTKKRIGRVFSFVVLAIFLIMATFPIYWMIISSFKNTSEIYQKVPTFLPKVPTTAGYSALVKHKFFRSVGNSFTIAMIVATGTIVIALPASYALARINFKGSGVISKAFFFAYLLPAAVMYLPMFILLSKLDLSNTIGGLILIYPTLTIPYAVWILVPYLKSIPKELEESAKVDGAGRVRTMFSVIFPLATPGIVTTFVFCFTMCWGEYMYALVNISSTKYKTFPLILSGLLKGDIYPWNEVMAGGLIACVPVILVYIFASKYLIGGLTSGAVKG